MTFRLTGPWVLIVSAGLLAGCAPSVQRDAFAGWEVPASEGDELPLESGQIVVTGSAQPIDLFVSLLPSSYNPYIHSAILSIENGKPYLYEEYAHQWPNPFAESPTDSVRGRVRRTPLLAFLERYEHIEIWDAGAYDKAAIVAFARTHFARRTPFDPHFDHADPEKLYCTEFVALALEAGGADPFEPVPNRNNRSARVVLDWLKVPESLIQADTLVAGGHRVATLSRARSLTDILVMDEVKRELYRRFTCDQKVGNLFDIAGPSVLIREPVERFIAAAMSLYPPDRPEPPAERVREEVAALALRMLGPYDATVDCD